MTTTWLCGDLSTAVAEALSRGTIANLTGARPVDEVERAGAYAALAALDEQQRQDAIVQELLTRLAPPFEPYPEEQRAAERTLRR